MQLKIQQKPTDKQVDDELNDLADALDDLNIPNDIPFNHDSPKKKNRKQAILPKKSLRKLIENLRRTHSHDMIQIKKIKKLIEGTKNLIVNRNQKKKFLLLQ